MYYTAQLTIKLTLTIAIKITITVLYCMLYAYMYNGTHTTVTALCAAVPRALLRTAATISAQRGPVPEQMG